MLHTLPILSFLTASHFNSSRQEPQNSLYLHLDEKSAIVLKHPRFCLLSERDQISQR